MNKISKLVVISIISLSGQACTQAGPFVTNISSDGNYGLNIEKCTVEMNAVMGGISAIRDKDCTTQNIKLRSQ